MPHGAAIGPPLIRVAGVTSAPRRRKISVNWVEKAESQSTHHQILADNTNLLINDRLRLAEENIMSQYVTDMFINLSRHPILCDRSPISSENLMGEVVTVRPPRPAGPNTTPPGLEPGASAKRHTFSSGNQWLSIARLSQTPVEPHRRRRDQTSGDHNMLMNSLGLKRIRTETETKISTRKHTGTRASTVQHE